MLRGEKNMTEQEKEQLRINWRQWSAQHRARKAEQRDCPKRSNLVIRDDIVTQSSNNYCCNDLNHNLFSLFELNCLIIYFDRWLTLTNLLL